MIEWFPPIFFCSQPVVHIGSVRQAACIVNMEDELMRTGDRAVVRFRFMFRPEYIKVFTWSFLYISLSFSCSLTSNFQSYRNSSFTLSPNFLFPACLFVCVELYAGWNSAYISWRFCLFSHPTYVNITFSTGFCSAFMFALCLGRTLFCRANERNWSSFSSILWWVITST